MAQPTTDGQHKALVRRLYEAVWNGGDLDVGEELHASDWMHHNSSNPEDIQSIGG